MKISLEVWTRLRLRKRNEKRWKGLLRDLKDSDSFYSYFLSASLFDPSSETWQHVFEQWCISKRGSVLHLNCAHEVSRVCVNELGENPAQGVGICASESVS